MLYQEQLYKLRRALERLSARPDDKAAVWSIMGDRSSILTRHDDDDDDVLSGAVLRASWFVHGCV